MGNYQDGKKLLYQIISDSKNKQNIESFLIPVFNNLAKIYESNGSLTKAEFYLLKAVNVFEKNSEFGFSIKITYANLAKVYARQGNFKKSKIYLEKAFGIETDFFGEDPQKFLQTIYELNSIYLYEFQVKDFLDSKVLFIILRPVVIGFTPFSLPPYFCGYDNCMLIQA